MASSGSGFEPGQHRLKGGLIGPHERRRTGQCGEPVEELVRTPPWPAVDGS